MQGKIGSELGSKVDSMVASKLESAPAASMPISMEIPLFPLKTLVFPGGKLNLQIFEPRYIDLVSHSMKTGAGFGICLLKEGDEVMASGGKRVIHQTGMLVSIVDWDQLDNGLLGVTVTGLSKFEIERCWQAKGGLLVSKSKLSLVDNVDLEKIPLHDRFTDLVALLKTLESHPAVEKMALDIDYDNLWELGWRLSELIPVAMDKKQQLLELDNPLERLERIEAMVAALASQI